MIRTLAALSGVILLDELSRFLPVGGSGFCSQGLPGSFQDDLLMRMSTDFRTLLFPPSTS